MVVHIGDVSSTSNDDVDVNFKADHNFIAPSSLLRLISISQLFRLPLHCINTSSDRWEASRVDLDISLRSSQLLSNATSTPSQMDVAPSCYKWDRDEMHLRLLINLQKVCVPSTTPQT